MIHRQETQDSKEYDYELHRPLLLEQCFLSRADTLNPNP